MAISFVGRGYNTAQGTATPVITFGTTNWSGASPQEGDIVILTIAKVLNSSGSFTINTSGYTGLTTNALVSASSNYSHLYCAYKIMGSTPDASVSITGFGSSSAGLVVGVSIFRGINTSNPIDVTTTTSITTNYAEPPSITTVTNGCMIIPVIATGMAGGRVITGAPTGYTLSFGETYTYDSTYRIMHGVAYLLQETAGSIDPLYFNQSGTGSSDRCLSATIALRPYIAPAGPANLKSYNTNLKANIKTINGNPIANVKSLDTNV